MAGMIDNSDIPDLPGFVSIKDAAQIMGITQMRVRQYVKEKRFPGARRFENQTALPLEEVQAFRAAPAGRKRKKAPAWRDYRSRGQQVVTFIQVAIRPGMRETVLARLKALKPEEHTFSRNVARYIMGRAEDESIKIELIWKDTEMPSEATRQQDLQRFQHDFPELDWETASYEHYEIYRHT
jgi:hypothetical protein